MPRPEAQETYVVRTFDGGTKEVTEYLSYSFFTTAGELSDARTGGRPSPFVTIRKVDDLTSELTPTEPGPGVLWIVVHDDRGGVGWQSHEFVVR